MREVTGGPMSDVSSNAHRRLMPIAVSLCALMCASSAFAQDDAGQSKQDAKKPTLSQNRPSSPNTTVNLLNLMVKRKLLSAEEAQDLIKQAEDESYVSRQAAKDATAKA